MTNNIITIEIPIANSSLEELRPIAEHFELKIEKISKSKNDPYYRLSTENPAQFFWFGINLLNKMKP